MVHTIDHRILIPASPDVIWDTISDISRNPRWQVDCREVAFLTSLREGQGVRWRYNTERGRSFVAEITAWYNKLGYEYHIVDGAPFKNNQGRLRLQEIAEGTIVQWTFNYETQGLFGGRIIGSRRSIENAMIDSLWTLWKQITAEESEEEHRAKSLMRDAPDVEQRAAYVSRHGADFSLPGPGLATVSQENVPASSMPASTPITIEEPPISDDDTRPRPSVTSPEPAIKPVAGPEPRNDSAVEEGAVDVSEPDFLRDLEEASFDTPTNPTGFPPVTAEPPAEDTPETHDTGSAETPAVESEPAAEAQEDEAETAPAEPISTVSRTVKPADTSLSPWELERLPDSVDDDLDTSKVSVFDLFGVPKPSETQESQAVPIEETDERPVEASEPEPATALPQVETTPEPVPTPPEEEPVADVAVDVVLHPPVEPAVSEPASPGIPATQPRTGLRLRQRRRLARLRRPE